MQNSLSLQSKSFHHAGWVRIAFTTLFGGWIVGLASGQGLLVDVRADSRVRLPRPIVRPVPQPVSGSYRIDSIDVQAKLSDQVAQVQVSQTFVNTGSTQLEVAFLFPLPYDGAIDRLTLLVDGKEYDARLLSAQEARRTYEEIVRKNRDPALLEWLGQGMFRTSVFPVPAGARRTVTLRYAQLCRKSHGLTDFLFPLSTARYTSKPLRELNIRVAIDSNTPIKNVYSATHAVKIERSDEHHAVVTHESKEVVPSEDFRLFFDTGNRDVGTSVISYRPEKDADGYFLMLASPELKTADAELPAKTVVFVVDRSGSMNGEKIEQARGALKFVLNNLRAGDLFNIVAYDSQVEAFRPELERFDDTTRQAALGFVDGLYAGGSTNIDAALQRAFGMLQDSSRPTYLVFLTDGLPTAGETNEASIVDATKGANQVRARLFTFGVGYDVNSRLLDKLARANFGQSEYVRPDEDIEAAVSKLYSRIEAPVLTDVVAHFDLEGLSAGSAPAVNRVYPNGPFDLFAGDQVVVVGRYRRGGTAKVTLRGTVNGQEQAFDFPAEFVPQSPDDANSFVAKLWATRRVGEIIDEIDLKGRSEELVQELVALATQHGILTPYTSFLADETSDVRNVTRNAQRALESTSDLDSVDDAFGFRQRAVKGAFQRAAAAPSAGGYGGYGGKLEQRGQEMLAENLGRGVVFYDHRQDKPVAVTSMFNAGRKTFFQRGGRWVDSSVSADDEKNAQQIERYSREYFDLVSRYGSHVAQYLAIDEPVLVKLDGQTYQW